MTKLCIASIILGIIFSFKPCYFIIRLLGEYFLIIPYVLICLGLHGTWKNKTLKYFKLSPTFVQTMKKIYAYEGNVIIADTAWFYGNSKHQEIRNIIDQNYYLADSITGLTNRGYEIYAKYSTEKFPLYIYKRKQ